MLRSIFLYLFFLNVMFFSSIAHSGVEYSPKNCEFTAIFPSMPKIQDVRVQGYFHQSATLIRRNYVMRVSCSIFNDSSVFNVPDSEIIEWARSWGHSMGISQPEITFENNRMGKVVTVKGAKYIQGNPTIYKAVVYHGKYSRMAMVVGAPSSIYPSAEIMSFLKSIYKNENYP